MSLPSPIPFLQCLLSDVCLLSTVLYFVGFEKKASHYSELASHRFSALSQSPDDDVLENSLFPVSPIGTSSNALKLPAFDAKVFIKNLLHL